MKSFFQFLRGKKPLTLYHGSHEPRETLALPPPKPGKIDYGNDGLAVYLSTSKNEASSYGKHVHTVEYHGDLSKHLNLDLPLSKQPSKHREKLIKAYGRQEYYNPEHHKKYDTTADFVRNMGIKHGAHESLKKLQKVGFHGGYGESSETNGTPTTVYSAYYPEKIKVKSREIIANKKNGQP